MRAGNGMRGFTLLEVLIAITVTALLGTGAFWLLSQSLTTRDNVEARADALQRLQRMDRLLALDFSQVVDRSVRDEYGDSFPPLMSGDSRTLVRMTRTGWRDAAALLQALETETPPVRRSQLQRVTWRLDEEKLYRDFWLVLDRSQDSEIRTQLILEKVRRVEIRYLNNENQWVTEWPVVDVRGGSESKPSNLPKAADITLETELFGNIRRVFPIAGSFVPPPMSNNQGGDTGGGSGGDEGAGGEAGGSP